MKKSIKALNAVCLFVLVTAGIPGLAYADDLKFEARLTGKQAVPEEITSGKGRVDVTFNRGFRYVDVDVRLNDLIGNFTAAHFHCAPPGENGPVAFGLVMPGPLALDGNTVRGRLKNLDYTGADCVGPTGRTINNIVSLAFAMREGLIYLNIHTDAFPGGEIRGQLLEDEDDDSITAPAATETVN